MKTLTSNLLIGLSILLPLIITVQLIIWSVRAIEGWLRSVWVLLLPEQFYFPGLATLTFLLLALAVGISSRAAITDNLWKMPGNIIARIPLVNNIYGMIKDLLELMGGQPFSDSSVVWVKLPESPGRLLGIVTKSGKEKQSKLGSLISEDDVAVFLPMSYQAGGYMVVVPRESLEKTELEPGEALQLIMSAGLGQRAQAESG